MESQQVNPSEKKNPAIFIEWIQNLGFKPQTILNVSCPKCKKGFKFYSDKPDQVSIQKFLDDHLGHNCFLGGKDGKKWKIQDDNEIVQAQIKPKLDTEKETPLTPPISPKKNVPIETPNIVSTDLPKEANPQAEDGHVDVANEIVEALARINLSPYESRILWVIFRKTYGWHKKKDQISFTQFEKATGLKRRHVQRTLEHLEKRKIIITSTGYSKIITYGFQKDYTKWRDVTSKGYKPLQKITRSAPPEVIYPLEVTDRNLRRLTQKKLTKEKIYVEGSTELRLASLLLEEIRKNKPDYKEPNLQAWARDIDLLLRRDGRSAETVEEVIRWAQADHGEGIGKWKGWSAVILSAGKLREKFDAIEIQMRNDKPKQPSW